MNGINKIQLKAWHFIAAIFLFSILLNIVEGYNSKQKSDNHSDLYLVELENGDFSNSPILEDCYMLFHVNDSEYCDRMVCNFNHFVKDKQNEANFFTVNLDKYPELYTEFNISGVPSILIFKNGEEVKRLLGVIPEHNLEKIYKLKN